MADITIRHGGGSHYVRPDQVYRTSVLEPIYGYQPGADVQAVAMAFTQGPDRGMMLQGLGALPGPIQRFLSKIQVWIAERKAKKLMQVPGNTGIVPPSSSGIGYLPGPAPTMAQQIAPQLAMQMTGVLQLASRYGGGYPVMASDALINRPLRAWYR